MGVCPLCGRELIAGKSTDKHHLIPKSKGGKTVELLHVVCHRKIHSLLTETELANFYHTWERLKRHPDIAKFIKWVSKKPANYVTTHREASDKRRKRK